MKDQMHLHTVVALGADTRTTHFESGEALLLRRGQIGTVVLTYDDGTFEVEFAEPTGRTYAMLTLTADQLIVLHDTPEQVPA